MRVETCDRCDSTILQQSHLSHETLTLMRQPDPKSYDTQDVKLCSTCWNDLWEWALGDDAPDRSDNADPMPLERLGDGVRRYIEDLEGVLEQLDAVAEDEGG